MSNHASPPRPFSTLPHPLSPTTPGTPTNRPPVRPFTLYITPADVAELKHLLAVSRITRRTYESTQAEWNAGVKWEWMDEGVRYWREQFDCLLITHRPKQQSRLNAIPQYLTTIPHPSGESYDIHFAALFSTRTDAAPIIWSHGWPGAWVEFAGMLEMLMERYTEETLPYHIIVPSLPGYLHSTPPSLVADFSITDVAYLFNALMTRALGFDAYVAQGGDIGSYVSWRMARDHEACTALHVNFLNLTIPPPGVPERTNLGSPPPPDKVIQGLNMWGYALEQGTRPATVGFAVGSSPVALLAWIGEKYLHGTQVKRSWDEICTFLSLYWFTDCYASGIWFYRYVMGRRASPDADPVLSGGYLAKPLGYSVFPREISRAPKHWVEAVGKLVWMKEHKEPCGHFAAWEAPELLWDDVCEFMRTVQASGGAGGGEQGAKGGNAPKESHSKL